MAPTSRSNHASRKSHFRAGNDRKCKEAGRTDGGEKAPPRNNLPLELQQLLLNIVENAFASRFNDKLPPLIQKVKHHLYDRDFASAFGNQAFLEAYAMRWSPSRALAYADLLHTCPTISASLESILSPDKQRSSSSLNAPKPPDREIGFAEEGDSAQEIKVVCLGGGAGAELLAFAGFLRCAGGSPYVQQVAGEPSSKGAAVRLGITAVDIANWSTVLESLRTCLITAGGSSQIPSRSSLASETAFVDETMLKLNFQQQDVLKMDASKLGPLFKDSRLVTMMFTLSELYCTSMKATTNLLLSITSLLDSGALLLIVDSPGSYSTVGLGRASETKGAAGQKKYPVQWLLDHTLLEAAVITTSKESETHHQWEKVYQCESRWFRLPEGLKYRINLEDMRYQLHMYRRL